MKVEIEIEPYDKGKGILLKWEEGYSIKIEQEDNETLILANSAGLISLANHLVSLAQNEVAIGTHIHLDEYNSLETDSIGLIIEKAE